MSKTFKLFGFSLLLILLLTPILSACSPQTTPTQVPATQPPAAQPTTAPPSQPTQLPTAGSFAPTQAPTQPQATVAEPTEETAQVGGKFVYAAAQQPDTLDIQKSGFGITCNVSSWIGGTLVSKNEDGDYIPYLADSWSISDDGLVWTLELNQDAMFHNGDPLTAADWVYTIERAKDPETQSPITKGLVDPISQAEAADEYTLTLTLAEPFYPLLENLTSCYMVPYSQRAIEEGGINYGRNPVGTGPYIFREWQADEFILLELNPDYTWGPEYFEGANRGPAYIQEVEYRVLPEYSTQLASFQAGAVDFIYPEAKDVPAIEDQGDKTVVRFVSTATFHLIVNASEPPFDDLNVRKAFAQAIDRQAVIDVATNGTALELRGPLSPSVIGYDPAVEDAGFGFDLEAARETMQEAGYTYGSDGMLQRDGQPFSITLKTPTINYYVTISQILAEQWRELGVDVEIQQFEWGTLSPQYLSGDFQIGTLEVGWPEADILYLWFHSSQIGTFWGPQIGVPELDELLELTRTSTDADVRQDYINQAQQYIAENLLLIPILAMPTFNAVNNRVRDANFSEFFNTAAYFTNSYIE